MPTTIRAWDHPSKPIPESSLQSPEQVFSHVCPGISGCGYKTVLQSSFNEPGRLNKPSPQTIHPANNGLVESIIKAYRLHLNLALRPDDIWLAILGQFGNYVNKHAEELRDKFVSFAGKRTLTFGPDRHSLDPRDYDYTKVARGFTDLIQAHVKDPGLFEWMMPGFSTTTPKDDMAACVMMMGSMKEYFDYCFDPCTCGIPTVTLLGEKADYEKLLAKLRKLQTYGREPTLFASLLTPIINRMILSFDHPKNPEVVNFWRTICYVEADCGDDETYTGWVTAFCFWSGGGRCLYNVPQEHLDMHAAQRLEAEEERNAQAAQHSEKSKSEMVSASSASTASSSSSDSIFKVPVQAATEKKWLGPVKSPLSALSRILFCRRSGVTLRESAKDRTAPPSTSQNGTSLPATFRPLMYGLHFALDDVLYHTVDEKDVPAGWVQVPISITLMGEEFNEGNGNAIMVAGSVGMVKSEDIIEGQEVLQPEVGWWVVTKWCP